MKSTLVEVLILKELGESIYYEVVILAGVRILREF